MKKYFVLLVLAVIFLTSCTITIDVDSLEELQYYKKYDQIINRGDYRAYDPYEINSTSYFELSMDIDKFDQNNNYYLELFFMTKYNFERFKKGYSFNAYQKTITENYDNYWREDNIKPGDYVLVVDYSSKGEITPPIWHWNSYTYDLKLKINKMYH
ncbi:MAG: hypothetical protein ACQESN_11750 [Thermotogota bacterium]